MLALLVTMLTGAPGSADPAPDGEAESGRAEIAQELADQVAAADGAPVLAVLTLDTQADLSAVEGDRAAVVDALQRTAEESQSDLEDRLGRVSALNHVRVVNHFWLTNAVLVEFSGGHSALSALADVEGIARISPNASMGVIEPETAPAAAPAQDELFTWGLERIGVDRIFEEFETRGEGIVVATLDTGVDITHPDLAGKMVTDDPSDPTYPGGWMEFDQWGGLVESQPRDTSNHGTHVAGTIHGGDVSGQAIGVAPGAEMMHGLVIPGGSGDWAQVIAGMQWAIAPTDADGNPAGRPADIVNMSLGANGFYQDMVQPTINMRAAGVLPVISIGNGCVPGGTGSPGNVYEALAVGNTTVDENVSNTSCGGVVDKTRFPSPPSHWPATYTKPDLSAPGTLVRSATPGGGYINMSGTSMAAPHLSGTAALMLAADPTLDVDEIQGLLTETSVWNDRYAPAPPDIRYGHGRIDAYEAFVRAAVHGGVQGTVTDGTTGEPVEGAVVTAEQSTRSATAGADGSFALRLDPGSYDLHVEFFGYQDLEVPGVEVADGVFSEVNAELAPVPTGTIAGTVTLDGSGQGVPAVDVELLDLPVDLAASTDATGTFAIAGVPEGTYELAARREGFIAPEPVEVTVTAGGTAVVNLGVELPAVRAAVMGTGNSQIRSVLEDHGYEVDIFHWGQIEQVRAGGYPLVVVIGLSHDVNQGHWDAFVETTDRNGTGIIFTDSARSMNNGVTRLGDFTGHPAEVDRLATADPVPTSYFEVTQEHPILEGHDIGDQVPLHVADGPKSIAWFGDYAGEGREVLAEVGLEDDTGSYGNGIAVQERAGNRYALLSSHSSGPGLAVSDWTPEATQLFTNAADWVTPDQNPNGPVFTVYDLQIDPDVVKAGEEFAVTAQVKNIGGQAGSDEPSLLINDEFEAVDSVSLAPGETGEIGWTVSREDLGTYDVQVATEEADFRVRAPYIDVEVLELETPQDGEPGPLVGATVELLAADELLEAGRTDAAGHLQLETTALLGEYTVVVRHPEAADGRGYLLVEDVTVIDDTDLVLRPRVLSSGEPTGTRSTDTFVTVVDLDLEQVSEGHQAWTYLRPQATAPLAFRFPAGEVVASLGTYDYTHVHQAPQPERDWWMAGEIVRDVTWRDPFPQRLALGGQADLAVNQATYDDGVVTVDWELTDGRGNTLRRALATDLRPFAELPEVLRLERVLTELRGIAPHSGDLVMRLQRDGQDVRVGAIDWEARPFTFTQEDLPAGTYTVRIEAQTGSYSGDLVDTTTFVVGPSASDPGDRACRGCAQ